MDSRAASYDVSLHNALNYTGLDLMLVMNAGAMPKMKKQHEIHLWGTGYEQEIS
jgi:hypothetical protein